MNPLSPSVVLDQTIDDYWAVDGPSLRAVVEAMVEESRRRAGTWALVSWTHSAVMVPSAKTYGFASEHHFIIVRFNRPIP